MEPSSPTALLQRHQGLIRKIASAYCRRASDRDDVVQEIQVQLWRSHDRFDGRGAESTWVYRLALNVAISFHRRERRHQERRDPLLHDPAAREPAAPDDKVQHLLACIEDLGPLDKALVLLYLDAQDHATMAQVLGLSLANVATKLHRIKARLRAAITARSQADQEPPHGT